MEPLINLENIVFKREARTILDGVSLTMKRGEHWVILGRNGSGKTTLLEMINGYLFPSSGKIDVLGERYGETDLRDMRKRIGYISQSLFEKMSPSDPVWEVVATGEYAFLRFYQDIPSDVKKKALELIEFVGLSKLKDQPLGTLSQGERKKIMLARTLMSEPSVLIMDEPCAGLDLYEREKFLANIESLRNKDLLMVYVTHHIEEIMPVFTHAALIEDGRIIKVGSKAEVLQADSIAQAFGVPVRIEWFRDRPWIKID
ncbi:MAG: ATP-binding cassette domain-containing protein [Gorillibacterium sp.]|nr:ATP-binding cassette domain-containing protein [Gorillibacterium sp.]